MSVTFSYQGRPLGEVPADARVIGRVHSLKDHTVLRLRQLGPADADELRSAFSRLSPQSRYMRFFSPVPRLSDTMLRRLTNTDGWNHLALLAETIPVYDEPPEPLGVARFYRLQDRPDTAEVAVTVIDEAQRRGLGALLLRALARLARNRGIDRFVASVLDENLPMKALIHQAGRIASVKRDGSLLLYEFELSPNPSAASGSA
jgi:RimJ/RimL family protein N-acetyltransferase